MNTKIIYKHKSGLWAVGSDDMNWIHLRKKKVDAQWTTKWYFPTIPMLFKDLFHTELLKSVKKVKELKELSKVIDETVEMMNETLKDFPRK